MLVGSGTSASSFLLGAGWAKPRTNGSGRSPRAMQGIMPVVLAAMMPGNCTVRRPASMPASVIATTDGSGRKTVCASIRKAMPI